MKSFQSIVARINKDLPQYGPIISVIVVDNIEDLLPLLLRFLEAELERFKLRKGCWGIDGKSK